MSDVGAPAAATADSDLKARIFAAFEHACRFGEVEVADQLLAIINSKWMKPTRAAPHQAPAPGPRHALPARAFRLPN